MRAPMLRVLAITLLLLQLLAGRAAAQPSPLSVARAPGADDCPDAAALLARIEAIRKSPPRSDQPAYRVAFARDEAGLHAAIISESTPGTRALDDTGGECGALAQATAVSLSLLFDADARALEEAASATPAPAPAPEVEPAPAPSTSAAADDRERVPADDDFANGSSSTRLHPSLALGGGVLFGVTRPAALALSAELGLALARLGVRAGALYAPPQAFDFASGRVREQLLAGSLFGCLVPWSHAAWAFDTCAGALVGAVHASAHGFADDRDSTRLWSALALDLRLGHTPAPLGASLSLTLLVPLRRQDFAIEDAGVAYDSLPVAALLTLRAALGTARR